MDKVMFNTYDEYNEEDYTFETVEEIIVEENEIEGSTWSRRTGVKRNTSVSFGKSQLLEWNM